MGYDARLTEAASELGDVIGKPGQYKAEQKYLKEFRRLAKEDKCDVLAVEDFYESIVEQIANEDEVEDMIHMYEQMVAILEEEGCQLYDEWKSNLDELKAML